MENTEPAISDGGEIDPTICANCKLMPPEEGYPTKLCTDCRKKFVDFPIPKWIYLSAAGILVLLVISLIRTPGILNASVHLARGEKAIDEHKYNTATKELRIALTEAPNSIIANANMIVASAYSRNHVDLLMSYDKIGSKKIDDQDLYNKTIEALDYYGILYPHDTLMYNKIMATDSVQLLEKIYKEDLSDPDDNAVLYAVADKYYDLKEYRKSEEILKKILDNKAQYPFALNLMSAICREEGRYDEALNYCDQILDMNREDIYGMVLKAKVEMKRKHDAEAEKYLAEASEIAPDDLALLEAKAMLAYFSNDLKESTKLLNTIIQQEGNGDHIISDRLSNLLNGKVKYR